MTPQPDYRIHAGPWMAAGVVCPNAIKSDFGGRQSHLNGFKRSTPGTSRPGVAARRPRRTKKPRLSNRTQITRGRVARYPQILGGTANGPQHAFVGDLSELWTGQSTTDIRKPTMAPTGAVVPSMDSRAPSPRSASGALREGGSAPRHSPPVTRLPRNYRGGIVV